VPIGAFGLAPDRVPSASNKNEKKNPVMSRISICIYTLYTRGDTTGYYGFTSRTPESNDPRVRENEGRRATRVYYNKTTDSRENIVRNIQKDDRFLFEIATTTIAVRYFVFLSVFDLSRVTRERVFTVNRCRAGLALERQCTTIGRVGGSGMA